MHFLQIDENSKAHRTATSLDPSIHLPYLEAPREDTGILGAEPESPHSAHDRTCASPHIVSSSSEQIHPPTILTPFYPLRGLSLLRLRLASSRADGLQATAHVLDILLCTFLFLPRCIWSLSRELSPMTHCVQSALNVSECSSRSHKVTPELSVITTTSPSREMIDLQMSLLPLRVFPPDFLRVTYFS
jgi:hypothetical protein